MDTSRLQEISANAWRIQPSGVMRVPAIIYADNALLTEMDDKVREQLCNVAALPGIVEAAYAMPDAHWGYGFPIGGVAAFDPDEGGVVSAGGVGFDISCGVRLLLTGLLRSAVAAIQKPLADTLFRRIPAGVGSEGSLSLTPEEMNAMLRGGAAWAVERGYGTASDLERIEEGGCMADAEPDFVSENAKRRQRREVGTLGSGNHYLEVQTVSELHDPSIAAMFGLTLGEVVVSIHCGSRGLGHQIGTEFLAEMLKQGPALGITIPDRELASAPIRSELGRRYLGAMRAAINCALANRQVLTKLTRDVFQEHFPEASLPLLFDVSHNTCKVEQHRVKFGTRELYVHRKGATRAFGPGHPSLPTVLQDSGQPVLIGGSMGTASYVLVGTAEAERLSFGSACHGAGRRISRHAALRQWSGRMVVDRLADRGILVRSPSMRGVAEEAPDAYKDVSAVVEAAERAGLARRVARLEPMITIKG
ncbi:MAG TPA: RtcB family protein [Alphaproteobacteria bacterium]|nr:RtcB family protein [Alphaproteobacteria bacterium]